MEHERFIARRRARFVGIDGHVNIPYGTVLSNQGGFLIHQNKRVCTVSSQNALDYCVQDDDGVNEIIAKCIEADGIVLASPVYHGGIAGGMKCVLDRLILAAGCGDNQLKHKVGAALCTLRRSGGMETYQQLLGTINTMEMVLVTSDYWNAVHGADKGEAMQDIEGVEVIEKLGRNIAWMLKVIDKAGIEPPESRPRTMMNFIR